MKRKRSFMTILLVVSLVLSLGLVGCSSSTDQSSEQPAVKKHIFKLSNVFTADQPLNITLNEVADNIKERTNGSIEFQIYPNGEIANSQDGVEQVVRGADFILVDSPSNMGPWVPDYEALIGPMLYDTREEYSQMCQSDLVKELNLKAEEAGIKVLALDYTFGFRSLAGQEAIKNPEEFAGKKWRVPKSQLWIDTLTAMGAQPITTAWSEVYSAVQEGVVAGFETSVSDMYDNHMEEIIKNVSLTKHFLGTTGVMISKTVWDSLTDEEQQIMQEEFTAGAIRNNERIDVIEDEARKAMEAAGVEFTEVDTQAFRDATKVVFDNSKFTPGFYDEMQDELAIIRSK
ncbi:MAG: TRAP transporter substrate-binding protein DctP [Eubacteriales bacterium]